MRSAITRAIIIRTGSSRQNDLCFGRPGAAESASWPDWPDWPSWAASSAAGPAADDAAQDGQSGQSGQDADSAAPGRPKHRSFWRELPVLIIIALVIALLIKSFVVQAFYIPSPSMEQTLD